MFIKNVKVYGSDMKFREGGIGISEDRFANVVTEVRFEHPEKGAYIFVTLAGMVTEVRLAQLVNGETRSVLSPMLVTPLGMTRSFTSSPLRNKCQP